MHTFTRLFTLTPDDWLMIILIAALGLMKMTCLPFAGLCLLGATLAPRLTSRTLVMFGSREARSLRTRMQNKSGQDTEDASTAIMDRDSGADD